MEEWESLIEDKSWLESWEQGHARWGEIQAEKSQKPLLQHLKEAEQQIQLERQAESKHIQYVRNSRDSLLKQLEDSKSMQQLTWVTRRFHKLVTDTEAAAEKMFYMRGSLLEELKRAEQMFDRALELAQQRIAAQERQDFAEKSRREESRRRDRELQEELSRLREETWKKRQESMKENDRKFREAMFGHSNCPKCGCIKPAGHYHCCHGCY